MSITPFMVSGHTMPTDEMWTENVFPEQFGRDTYKHPQWAGKTPSINWLFGEVDLPRVSNITLLAWRLHAAIQLTGCQPVG